jgi:antitoxin component YwqK of YwqJK toxin-antitoxin module
MKAILFALSVALLMVGFSGADPGSNSSESNQSNVEMIDLDDKETLGKIMAEAIDDSRLERRAKDGENLEYVTNEEKPYSGWVKVTGGPKLIQFKDGKVDGLAARWYSNGKKYGILSYKNGKPDGLGSYWYRNGQKKMEGNFKDGKLMSLIAWKPNGEKCPFTKVVNGKGVQVNYNEMGKIVSRRRFKDGEEVFRNYNKSESDWPQPNQTSPQTPPAKPPAVSKIDLDDAVILEKIIADAIDVQKLQNRSNSGSLMFAPMKQIPYTGWSKYITAKGQVLELRQWEKGRWEDGLNIQFYESGKNRSKSNFKQGRRDGLFTEWYESGHRKFVENYKEGHLDGFSTDWYESGQKQGERNYKDGKKDGLWTEWYENGKIEGGSKLQGRQEGRKSD